MFRRLVLFLTLGLSTAAHANVNVTINPLGALAGALRGTVEFEAGSNWSVGPVLGGTALKLNDVSITSGELGIRANYFAGGTFSDGWYFGPEVSFSNFRASAEGESVSVSAISGSAFGGYFWIWDSFNMNLGAGLAYVNIPPIDVAGESVSLSAILPTFEFKIGVVF